MKKGLLIIITGKGRGITEPALGTMFRSLGRGFAVCLIQFTNEVRETGDFLATNWPNPLLEIHTLGDDLGARSGTEQEKTQAAREAWQLTEQLISSGKFQVVVLEEVTNLVKNGAVTPEDVVALLGERPEHVHVIVTGNDVPEALIAAADLVTQVVEVK